MIVAGSSLTNIPASLGAQLGRRHRRTDRGRLCATDTGDRLIPVPKSKAQFHRTKSERQDSLAAANGPQMRSMNTTRFLKTRVPAQTKALIQTAPQREYLTEATWFRRAIEAALRKHPGSDGSPGLQPFRDRRSQVDAHGGGARLYVRLRGDDRMILRERATARGMAATYASVLLRSHLRNLQPLPKEELLALKRVVAELGAIGRNLNQIARAANQRERPTGPSWDDLQALLKVCEALRTHVKDMVKANVISWAVGHADRSH